MTVAPGIIPEVARIADRLRPAAPDARPLKIFYWPASLEDGCFRYRVEMPAQELARLGHEVQTSQQVGPWVRDEADIIVGQRVCTDRASAMWAILAQHERVKLVYEVDDDLFGIDPKTNGFGAFFRQPGIRQNMITNLRLADLVTVTTEPLAALLRRHNPNVVVLPNCVRSEVYDVPAPLRRGKADGMTLLGWQGSPTHGEDWLVCKQAVIDALHADQSVRMRFLGAHHFDGMPVGTNQVDWMDWQPDLTKHYKRVGRFDVSLAPLADTVFNRSKSGLRVQESGALGVPVIASKVPAYTPWVQHGTTGFLATNRRQWRAAIEELKDPTLRQVMGLAARQVARAWSIEANAHRWVDAYRSIL